MELDKLDWSIIGILEKNGRTPNNEIAKLIGVSEGTVRNRINKLTENDFLRIRGQTNPNERQDESFVYMGIKIAVNRDSMKVAQAIAKLNNVKAVSVVTGRYDLLVEVFVEPYNIIKFLSTELSTIDSITAVESFIALHSENKYV
ncbi:MAG: Lrp/AsnC family transcriptional regulator [Spirochaetales bacterium]|nr:MAG: Lrp/AsnC family transcriptional regulator [Spirochaetales bacterium]